MNFDEKQTKQIYEFITKYNDDDNFRNNVEKLYDNNIYQLSILDVYALEVVLRYGMKEVFNSFIKVKGNYNENQAIDLYDQFRELLFKDETFKQCKLQQFRETPTLLSEMELFIFSLMNDFKRENQDNVEQNDEQELEYEPLNLILYSTDDQIRETLENLFLGELIYQILDYPEMRDVKNRIKEKGRIAKIDKPVIIQVLQKNLLNDIFVKQFNNVIDDRFVQVKMNLLLGNNENVFGNYLKYNTNISSSEVFGFNKNTNEYFNDFLKQKYMKLRKRNISN